MINNMNEEVIKKIREDIDSVDAKMLALYEERMALVKKVYEYKKENGLSILNANREQEVKDRLLKKLNNEEIKKYYIDYIDFVLKNSKDYQRFLFNDIKVAYSGEKGAFAYFALKKLFNNGHDVRYNDFKSAYEATLNGETDYTILPIENSYAGEVGQVIDMLFQGDLFITNIYDMPINHSLLCPVNSSLEKIKTVVSHPQALAQCHEYLRKHNFDTLEALSTSQAAKYVCEKNDETLACIASENVVDIFNLKIIEKNINEQRSNTTRFAVFAKNINFDDIDNKLGNFILTFTVKNETGSLSEAISIIASYGYNMRCLRSRPMKDLMWRYYFYVEIEGSINNENGERMLKALRTCCDKLKIAGIYNGQ